MIRRIRAAWMAFCRPELVEESPEETAQVLMQIRRESSRRTLACVVSRLEELTNELRVGVK